MSQPSTTAKARSCGLLSPDVIKIPTLGLGTTRLFHHDGAMKGNAIVCHLQARHLVQTWLLVKKSFPGAVCVGKERM